MGELFEHLTELKVVMLKRCEKFDSYGLSFNESLTIEQVIKHTNFKYDICALSSNPNISYIDMINNFEFNWDWIYVFRRLFVREVNNTFKWI